MDLTPSPEQEQFRAGLRAWLKDNLPWEYGRGSPPRFDVLADEVAFGREWQAGLASAGYVGVAWPIEYGGRGAGPIEHFIVQEELARGRAPELVGRLGVDLVVDMRAEGVEVRPLRQLTGEAEFNEVFLTDVVAPGSPLREKWARQWLWSQSTGIAGGTTEIQRTIVGERLLGLPRP